MTAQSAAITRPSAANPRSDKSSGRLDKAPRRGSDLVCLSSISMPPTRPWLTSTCATAAAAKGTIKAANIAGCGTLRWLRVSMASSSVGGTLPASPTTTYTTPAAKPATAYIAPLNRRSATGIRRLKLSTAVAPTIAAPTGPSSTTAARVDAELGDHAEPRDARKTGVDSKIRNSSASTAYAIHQRMDTKPTGTRMSTP